MIPANEMGAIVCFAEAAREHGFEVLSIQAAFPDAVVRHGGQEYRAEFEFASSNFRNHGHDPRECDLVICWRHDGDCGGLPVLALSSPGWENTSLDRPSAEVLEAAYWRWHAERLERQLRAAQSKIAELQPQKEERAHGPYICPTCECEFDTSQAFAAHCRWHCKETSK